MVADDPAEKLVKVGVRIVRHGRHVVFRLAEVAVPQDLFAEILPWIDRLRPGQRRGCSDEGSRSGDAFVINGGPNSPRTPVARPEEQFGVYGAAPMRSGLLTHREGRMLNPHQLRMAA